VETRIQIVAIVGSAALLFVIFELVRRKRLMERYALLWLFSTMVVLGLAVWRDLLEDFAATIGIFYAPSALFAVALGLVLMLLLHFSLVVSRLADQSKVLAQRMALLQQRVDELEAAEAARAGGEPEYPAVAEERRISAAR
jgi:hypothetical protein